MVRNNKELEMYQRVETPFPSKMIAVKHTQPKKGSVVFAACYRNGAMSAGDDADFFRGMQAWAAKLNKQGSALVCGGDFNIDMRPGSRNTTDAQRCMVSAALGESGLSIISREGRWETSITRRPYGPRQTGQAGSQIDWILANNKAVSQHN